MFSDTPFENPWHFDSLQLVLAQKRARKRLKHVISLRRAVVMNEMVSWELSYWEVRCKHCRTLTFTCSNNIVDEAGIARLQSNPLFCTTIRSIDCVFFCSRMHERFSDETILQGFVHEWPLSLKSILCCRDESTASMASTKHLHAVVVSSYCRSALRHVYSDEKCLDRYMSKNHSMFGLKGRRIQLLN